MAKDRKYTLVSGVGTLSAANQAKVDKIDIIDERTTSQSFDATEQVTNFGQDVVLTVPQLPVTDLNIQGQELASTQRVQDMIDKTGSVNHYHGLTSIDIPTDAIFNGMTMQGALNAIVAQATIKQGDKHWDYSMSINSTVSTLAMIFGNGYIYIHNVGDDHHKAEFYGDNGDYYMGTYDSVNAPHLMFEQYLTMDKIDALIDQHHPTTIIHDIASNQPTAAECKEVFELIPNHDFAEDKDFYIKNSSRDRVILVHYFALSTSTQANPGNFYYEVLNLAV